MHGEKRRLTLIVSKQDRRIYQFSLRENAGQAVRNRPGGSR
jgi:hypothetical protein